MCLWKKIKKKHRPQAFSSRFKNLRTYPLSSTNSARKNTKTLTSTGNELSVAFPQDDNLAIYYEMEKEEDAKTRGIVEVDPKTKKFEKVSNYFLLIWSPQPRTPTPHKSKRV